MRKGHSLLKRTIPWVAAFVVALAGVEAARAAVQVTVTPSTVRLERNRARSFTITYRFSGFTLNTAGISLLNAGPGELLDASGSVIRSLDSGGTLGGIAAVPYTLTETVTVSPAGGAGSISFAEVDGAAANGTGRLAFRRTFDLQFIPLGASPGGGRPIPPGGAAPLASSTTTFDSFPVTVTVPLIVDTGSDTLGLLRVNRVDLYFLDGETRKGEATVSRGTRGLKAHADMDFSGSGYLEGAWTVDGQVVERVRKYVSFGQKVTLSTSDIPGISTFVPGLHAIRFDITDPVPSFDLPVLAYLVTEKEGGAADPIAVIGPGEGRGVSQETTYTWTVVPRAVVYIATWRRAFDGREVLSAMVKEPAYRAPEALFAERFVPGVRYTWQVNGYDSEGRLVGEGPVTGFTAR